MRAQQGLEGPRFTHLLVTWCGWGWPPSCLGVAASKRSSAGEVVGGYFLHCLNASSRTVILSPIKKASKIMQKKNVGKCTGLQVQRIRPNHTQRQEARSRPMSVCANACRYFRDWKRMYTAGRADPDLDKNGTHNCSVLERLLESFDQICCRYSAWQTWLARATTKARLNTSLHFAIDRKRQ